MRSKISTAVAALSVALPAVATPYSFEVEGLYARSDARFTETTVRSADGTWFWGPVQTAGAPLAEAAFADRASSITVGLSRTSHDVTAGVVAAASTQPSLNVPAVISLSPPDYVAITGASLPRAQRDGDAYRASARYVHANGWLGEMHLLLSRSDEASFLRRFDDRTTDVSLAVGKYVASTLTVNLAFARRQIDSDTTIDVCLSLFDCQSRAELSTGNDDETRTWSASARYLASAGRLHHAVTGTIAYATRTTETNSSRITQGTLTLSPVFRDETYYSEANLAYTFYPRRNFGAGISFSRFDGEFGSDNATSVSAQWYVTDRIGVRARYSDRRQAAASIDTDTLELALSGRF